MRKPESRSTITIRILNDHRKTARTLGNSASMLFHLSRKLTKNPVFSTAAVLLSLVFFSAISNENRVLGVHHNKYYWTWMKNVRTGLWDEYPYIRLQATAWISLKRPKFAQGRIAIQLPTKKTIINAMTLSLAEFASSDFLTLALCSGYGQLCDCAENSLKANFSDNSLKLNNLCTVFISSNPAKNIIKIRKRNYNKMFVNDTQVIFLTAESSVHRTGDLIVGNQSPAYKVCN